MADSAPHPPGTSADRWPVAWVVSSMVAVVALAFWQQEPGWWRLVGAIAGTLSAAWFLTQVRRPRIGALVTVAGLTVGSLTSAVDTATFESIRTDWQAWSASEREGRAQRVSQSVEEVATTLRLAAEQAIGDSALVARALAGDTLPVSPPLSDKVESALLVFRRGMLVGRAGQMHTPIFPGAPAGVQLVEGAFHTSLVARARTADGAIEVVSVALITSAPPSDRFTRTVLQSLPSGIDVAHTQVRPPGTAPSESDETVFAVRDGARTIAQVHATTYTDGENLIAMQQRSQLRSSVALAIALVAFLTVAWRRPVSTGQRLAAAAAVLLAVAVAPLSGLSNVSILFDPRSYFTPAGGPLTSTIVALLITAAIALAAVLFVLRATLRRPARWLAALVVLFSSVAGPFLLRELARGITLPPAGASYTLWIAWQLALALVGATVLLASASAGRVVLADRPGLRPAVPVLIALATGMLAPVLLRAPGAWPAWYPVLWIAAIAALAITRRGLSQVIAAAVIAGAGAATLTWGATIKARVALAQHDIERIGQSDLDAQRLLERFAISLADEAPSTLSAESLLGRYAASDLARAGYSARLARWSAASIDTPVTVLELSTVLDTIDAQSYVAMIARESGTVEFREARDGLRRLLLAAVPAVDGSVTTIALPARTSLVSSDPFSAFIGITGERWREAPYSLTLSASAESDRPTAALTWHRRGNALHGDGVAGVGRDVNRVHAEVDVGGIDVLLPRGALLVVLDVLVVLLIWTAVALADGALGRIVAVRRARWSRSYRVQLSVALLGFFITPALVFAFWSWFRLQGDDRATRELLVRETLRVAAAEQETRAIGSSRSSTGAPLFLYRDGVLRQASDPILDALAPLGRLLPVSLSEDELGSDDTFLSRRLSTGSTRPLVGFRLLTRPGAVGMPGASVSVLATPARGNEFVLDDRREDLGILVLFATMLGALAAVWSSGIAARALARPVGALREAALDIAAGRAAPALGAAPATEFAPVYRAFSRMADDLQTSRAALQAAQRRTEAVLQNVASGVLALLRNGDIILANPRAGALLGEEVRMPGASLDRLSEALLPLATHCTRFLAGADDEEAFELSMSGRQLQARLTRLPTGAVLTLDDITELATAQRVLAWGEMARQVAHEIKNPLTPIRLGVQHLRRAYRDGRGDFGDILDRNVGRVLEEIDHLDEIARAFSRYGTAPSEREPGVPVDVGAVVQDVVALEKLGDHAEQGQRVEWRVELSDAMRLTALAQRDELREVLINVLENARLAGATSVLVRGNATEALVTLEVVDDGSGIAPDVLPRVFEPHFSTRTSGSGLGLAISRRLIEGWGGTISVTSGEPRGTTVHIALVRTSREPMEAAEPVRR